jgi:hypothetical protein
MVGEPRSQRPRDWVFKGFLLGALAGAMCGLATYQAWDWRGPYRFQIPVGLCGLIGGAVGLSAGVVHRLIRRHQAPK